MVRPPWRPSGLNYPMLLLVVLWAAGITVFMFREPAIAAALMAMVPVVVARSGRA